MFLLLFIGFLVAAAEPKQQLWPREVILPSKQKVLIYQPQVTSISDNRVTAQAAFKVTKNKKETYGSFSLKADALIAKDQGLVTLKNAEITKLEVPAKNFNKDEFEKELQKSFEGKQTQISYQSLLNNLAITQGEAERPPVEIKNDPPAIVFMKEPSLLIMISGEPKWVDVGSGVERIINTSALFMREKRSKTSYLWAMGRWFSSDQPTGPYSLMKSEPTSKFVITKEDLIKAKKVDPIHGTDSSGNSVYPPGVIPAIIVATKPTELLQSQGDPKFNAVEGTGLLFMSNSPNSIFLETQKQDYFALLSGRWFTATNLNGPWRFVPGKQLPADFKKIPMNSEVSEVLVSIPGTSAAKQAQIASQIPQTAKVPKTLQPEKIVIDGDSPKWMNIQGTNLRYVENANTPLIMVNEKQYYAIQNAVWFTATSVNGPWNVALAVPAEIYQIPSSSPLYYVTYVRIYNVTEDSVIVGYTPGYQGTYVSADGTIVYGTGYVYPAYTSGQAWYPPPATYGFGVGYGMEASMGFFVGFSMGSMMYPWGWGGCCWGPRYVDIDVTNIYTKWGEHKVITGNGGHGMTINTIGDQKFARAHGSSNIYTTKDGELYRRTGRGDWQKQVGPNSWSDVDLKKNVNAQNLEQVHNNRIQENRDFQNRNPQRSPSSTDTMPRLHGGGGGYRGGAGGGGFRGGGGRFRR
ncbi:MAG: hypothetical protein JSU04_16915 [Bdellovibrionales bacterium]|nr:hypothetical protein [Bdellovibrionales bacterium]